MSVDLNEADEIVARAMYADAPARKPGSLDPIPWEAVGEDIKRAFLLDAKAAVTALHDAGMLVGRGGA